MRRAIFVAICVIAIFHPRFATAQEHAGVGDAPTKRRVTKMPKLRQFVEATYPAQKKANGEGAVVVLTIEIAATGEVTSVAVAQSAGALGKDFADAAVAAAKQFEFEPAEVDDKPAPAKITYRYRFTISAPVAPPLAPSSPVANPLPPPPPLPIATGKIDEVTVHALANRPRDNSEFKVNAADARKIAG